MKPVGRKRLGYECASERSLARGGRRLAVITQRIVPSVLPREGPAGHAERSFRSLLEHGAKLLPAGEARRRPARLLSGGYTPKHAFDLFDTGFYVTNVRQNEDIRFFVAYVVQGAPGRERIHPRLFYKDLSLVWRSASHFVRSENDNWVGKGELKVVVTDGVEMEVSDEATTDLPLEIQSALESLIRRVKRIPYDQMWADDRLWLPLMLDGTAFSGRFIFDGDAMLDHQVELGQERRPIGRPQS